MLIYSVSFLKSQQSHRLLTAPGLHDPALNISNSHLQISSLLSRLTQRRSSHLRPIDPRPFARRTRPEVVAATDKDALSGPVGARRSVQHFVTPDRRIVRAAAPVLDATPAVGAHLISAVTRPLLSSLRRRAAERIGRFLALPLRLDARRPGPESQRHLAATPASFLPARIDLYTFFANYRMA